MMPVMDGKTALKEIRILEADRGVAPSQQAKIVMTTALADLKNVVEVRGGNPHRSMCDAYLRKPIQRAKLLDELRRLELIS